MIFMIIKMYYKKKLYMTQYEHIIFVSIEFITLSLHDHMRFEVMNMWKGSWLVLMSHLVTSLITFMSRYPYDEINSNCDVKYDNEKVINIKIL